MVGKGLLGISLSSPLLLGGKASSPFPETTQQLSEELKQQQEEQH